MGEKISVAEEHRGLIFFYCSNLCYGTIEGQMFCITHSSLGETFCIIHMSYVFIGEWNEPIFHKTVSLAKYPLS